MHSHQINKDEGSTKRKVSFSQPEQIASQVVALTFFSVLSRERGGGVVIKTTLYFVFEQPKILAFWVLIHSGNPKGSNTNSQPSQLLFSSQCKWNDFVSRRRPQRQRSDRQQLPWGERFCLPTIRN